MKAPQIGNQKCPVEGCKVEGEHKKHVIDLTDYPGYETDE